jgi:CxxC motif-containing protein
MNRKMTCIECPKGCALSVDYEGCRFIKVSGNECPKAEKYAASEIEDPVRILTSAVLAKNLSIKMVPVRTDKPVPKPRLIEGMGIIKRLCITEPVIIGDVIFKDFLLPGVNLIATRSAD